MGDALGTSVRVPVSHPAPMQSFGNHKQNPPAEFGWNRQGGRFVSEQPRSEVTRGDIFLNKTISYQKRIL